MKVLVVDDELIIRVGIQTILEQASGTYIYAGSAGNGKSALNEIERLQPDIVITDIKMPEMDGIQLIQEIRRRKLPIGIIVLSSYSEFELVKEAMKQGAADYILKLSLTEETLISALDEAAKKVSQEQKGFPASMPVKLILSDYLAQMGEIPDEEVQLNKTGEGHGRLVCVYLRCIQAEGGDIVGENLERVVENLFNEEFTAWCIKIDDMAYAVIIFGMGKDTDDFLNQVAQRCIRCADVLYDVMNVKVNMYIGAPMKHPSQLRSAFQSAVDVEKIYGGKEGRIFDCRQIGEARKEVNGEKNGGDSQWAEIYEHFRETRKRDRDFPPAVRKALEYMKTYYDKELTLNEVADVVNLNPSYFSFLFNHTLKINFSSYLMCLRIHHSKKLLRETDYKIYEIAEMVGYRNSYYFNRIFKRIVNFTPMEYRKR